MSFEAIGWAYKTEVGSPARKAVLLVLANYADENDSSYPGIPKIARMTELSERTVQRAVSDLEDMGVVRVVRKTNSVNRYHLDLGWCQAVTTPGDTVTGGGVTVSSDTKKTHQEDTETPVAPRGATSSWAGRKRRPKLLVDMGEELEAAGRLEKPPLAEVVDIKPRRLSTVSLVERFASDALASNLPPGQRDTNKGALGTWVKKQRGQGITLVEIEEAMRIFFVDPRGYIAGDQELWRAFVNRFSSLHSKAAKNVSKTAKAADHDTDYEKEQSTWVKLSSL